MNLDDKAKLTDEMSAGVGANLADNLGLSGVIEIEVLDEHGRVKFYEVVHNLITDVGDAYYGDAGAALCANATVTAPDGITGMRLGTGSTAPSKTGAGAAIVTYVAGTAKAIDGAFPTTSQPGGAGTARVEKWKTSWLAGEADGAALREVVITNETPLSDVAGVAGNTVSRGLFGPFTLGVLDTISITWNHNLLGA